MAFIPRVGAPFLDHRGEVSKEWRDYLQQIPADQAIAAIRAEIQALANRVNDIDQNAPETHNLLGQGSVRVFGDLTQGNATAQLDGDEDAPAASHYYGTDETGARGFRALLLAALSDVSADAPTAGQVLAFNGTEWAPATNLATATFNYISADGEPYATEDGGLYIGV
jgi:hypothetical protein